MAARVLAVVAAIAMVAGALFARSRIDDDEERSTTTLRLVCTTELAGVCDGLAASEESRIETRVEPPATTADALVHLGPGQRPSFDGWLATAPWPAIVAENRSRAGDAGLDVTTGRVLARSPVVLAVRADRRSVLEAACGGTPGWKCLGQAAGKRWEALPGGKADWGDVKPGHPSVDTASGLTVLGGATVGYFDGRGDLSSADLDEAGYQDWLDRLERAVPGRPASPFQTMLTRLSSFDAVGTLEAEAGPLLATASNKNVGLLYPSPVATADVVLATTGGRAADLLTAIVSGAPGRRALARSGWRVAGEPAAAGVPGEPELPAASNLPEPGVLDALRRRVHTAGG